MRLDPRQERGQHCAAGPDLIGQGQQAERAPSRVALGLAIERDAARTSRTGSSRTGLGPAQPRNHVEPWNGAGAGLIEAALTIAKANASEDETLIAHQ
jgi:hypothetical protein